MNAICMQRNYGYNLRRDAANSKSRFDAADHSTFMVPNNSTLEDDFKETREVSMSENISDNEIDSMFLLNQRELEGATFISRMNQNTGVGRRVSQETTLTKNQEDVLKIIQLMGVELRNKINWNSDGSSKLTDEQIEDLKAQYDVENLSEEEYYNLLVDLVNLNVISGEDFEKQFIQNVPPEVAEHGGMVIAASNDFETKNRNYLDKFLTDTEIFEYYFRSIEDGKAAHKSNLVKMQEYYEECRERSQRLADIFRQIQRKEQDIETTSKAERVFNGLDVLGPFAADKVKEAWDKAEKESGVNGYGMNSEGKFTNITALFAMSLESVINGGGSGILGSTVDSAKRAVQKALDRLGIPENDEDKKEKSFYESFLRFLN